MSDKILRALMQLFAIVANTDEVGMRGREIVERFLRRQLGTALVGTYLGVYDKFLETFKGSTEAGKVRKRTSVNSVKVLRICTDINRELEQKQKIIVLIRLLEFVHTASSSVTDLHLEFIKTVSDTFSINAADFENCFRLVSDPFTTNYFQNEEFLVINRNDAAGAHRHIQREGLAGNLVFLRISEPEFFVFSYHGNDQLVLDGRSVLPDSVQVFEPGSVIRGPKLNALYYNDIIHNYQELSVDRNITFRVQQLGYSFSKSKTGLHELSFATTSKNLVGIMGNSGAGKTTLLNLLNGSATPTTGKVLINGTELHANQHKLHGLIGNIPQDDLLIEELSVYQNLFYSSKLYFGGLTDQEIGEKVDRCLESLGLYEIKDLLVGDPLNKFISGGQRKRLNIGLELIREPEILFVDEPTSGLSSNDAENVMDLLKQLTLAGKLIFVVIHQPSSEIFKLFDQLLILDTGGFPVYFGNPVDSVRYFKQQMHFVDFENSECPECGNINPEEIFRMLESRTVDEYGRPTGQRKISSEEWYKLYVQEFTTAGAVPPGSGTQPPVAGTVKVASPVVQFFVYFHRNLFAKLNNRQYLTITLLEGPVLALILGFALRAHEIGQPYRFGTNPNIPVYMFICTIVALFLGLIVSADEIIQDKKILKRESFLQLSRHSYLLSKTAFLFLVSALQSLLFLAIGNTLLGFSGLFAHYWLVLFSVSCCANLLGLNISSGLKTRVAVYILIPFLVIPQIMLSGVMVKFEDLCPEMSNRSKVPLIGNIMASRWAFEALAVDQFKNNPYEKQFFELDRQFSNAEFISDYWVPVMEQKASDLQQHLGGDPAAASALVKMIGDEMNGVLAVNSDVPVHEQPLPGRLTAGYLAAVHQDLDSIERAFIRVKNNMADKKQALLLAMNLEKGVEPTRDYRNRHDNGQLDDMVLNNGMKEKTVITNGHIVRKFEPVFISAASGCQYGAPFYAHSKSVFGRQLDTTWYNVIVIWGMTLLLYVVLYYDLLRKLLERKFRA